VNLAKLCDSRRAADGRETALVQVVKILSWLALQQGTATARNIERDLRGGPRQNFHYLDKGSLATIGRAAAIAQFGKIHISGFVAWLSWLFVHIFFLIGFRNRIIVLIQWAWSYFTYERGARLITGDEQLPSWTALHDQQEHPIEKRRA